MVLVRVYGNSTDKFIDRDAEIRNMEVPFKLIPGLPAVNQGNIRLRPDFEKATLTSVRTRH